MYQLILHIPHSSTKIPIKEGYVVNDSILQKEILKLTDWYTDDLFYSPEDIMLVADFSRIFCDPERFANDQIELMAKKGMGVLYEKTDSGEIMRIVSPELREKILKEYYRRHHKKLNEAVNNQLQQYFRAVIIDCHSFSDIPFIRDEDQNPNRPEFNLGTDSFHTPRKFIDISIEFFKNKGFSLGIDRPYEGTIVPLEHYKKNKNVHSVMLEVNRKLYLKENSNEKSERFDIIKKVVKEYIVSISKCL
ncbi:MAG: N-formylglutamate amidohydrolase [Bacteroidota bacterium]